MTMDLKTEQMIALVLQINGYAKPADLHSLPEDRRAEALQAYYQQHGGSSALHWRDEQLWEGAENQSTPPATAVQPTVAPLADPLSDVPVAAPIAAPVGAVGGSFGEPASSGPDVFGDLAPAPQPAAVGVATLDPAVAASPFGVDTMQTAAPVTPTPLSQEPLVADTSFYAPPVDSALEADFMPEPLGTPAPFVMATETPVSPWWWVLAILWAPLGGVVAYFVVKGSNPGGASRLLKVSLLVWGVSILLGIVLGTLPMLLLR